VLGHPDLDALGVHIEASGVEVEVLYCEKPDDRGGVFFHGAHRSATGPSIEITRPRGEQNRETLMWAPTAEQSQEVLFTLAHEFGHCLSWREVAPRYEAFFTACLRFKLAQERDVRDMPVTDPLTPEETRLIEEEEERAWTLGRRHVRQDHVDEYDAHAQMTLAG
jgi:hypothetical protein